MNSGFEKKINEFWDKNVWKSNIKHIHNEQIKNTIYQIQKLESSIKPNKRFFLLNDEDFEIKTNDKIKSQIEKIKNENIVYIKTHADCIPEYHYLMIDLKKKLLFL